MSTSINDIDAYYGREGLVNRIKQALVESGHDLNDLHREHTSGFDEFHIGGRTETRNLARIAELTHGVQVLDLGGGIGGPARTIAEEFGCAVQGLDITAEFCRAADLLSQLMGLSERVTFRQGSATAIPFEDDQYDVVWMQHSGMNIADKDMLYSEIARVLKPGGRFVLHEIIAGDGQALHFPVLWANRTALSHLATESQVKATMSKLGFRETHWEDVTQRSIEWFEHLKKENEQNGGMPVGVSLLFGADASASAANVFRNLKEGRITVVQGCFELTA